jgi:hypothetical protein
VNPSFVNILKAPLQDRRDLFLGAANRLGTPEANIEKDFWVCWTLDALFNTLQEGHPRLLFKGGTSLSKAYGLISRFSEDIDITVFREDIGQQISITEFEALSKKKRQARLDAIKSACREYIRGSFCEQLNRNFQEMALAAGIDRASALIVPDDEDPDGQSLLFWYPSVTSGRDEYIRRAIKIESGAKSALDPHQSVTISPYVADDLPALSLAVPNITTVAAERTFWDKVIILHGVRQWFDKRGVLRQLGQRVSRHYYDVYRMMQSDIGIRAAADGDLVRDCARHARLFFGSPDLGLELAYAGTFSLKPSKEMIGDLRRDYDRMAGMIIGEIPRFDAVMESVGALENRINKSL